MEIKIITDHERNKFAHKTDCASEMHDEHSEIQARGTDGAGDVKRLLGLEKDPNASMTSFKIRDLAHEFGVTLRSLRFYEDRGLLSPQRRGVTRLYSRRDRARLRLVLVAKVLGFSLTEAKQIIEVYDQPDGKRRQMELALSRFREQRKELMEQKQEIDEALSAMDVSTALVNHRLAALPKPLAPIAEVPTSAKRGTVKMAN